VHLDPTGCELVRNGAAGHAQHGLGRQLRKLVDQPRLGDDHLRQALTIAQDQKADLTEPSQPMQPAGKLNWLAHVLG
jgi:hypothetical protein